MYKKEKQAADHSRDPGSDRAGRHHNRIEYLAGNLRAGEPGKQSAHGNRASGGKRQRNGKQACITSSCTKHGAASIEFDSSWAVSDTETESVLEVEADTLVTMLVTPAEGKLLAEASVVDYDFNAVTLCCPP